MKKNEKVICIKKMRSSIKVGDKLVIDYTYKADDHNGKIELMLVFVGDSCGFSSKFFKRV